MLNREPDDFRRDYSDLRIMMESGSYLRDDNGQEYFETRMPGDKAADLEARLDATPRNGVIMQTPAGRFQVEVTETGLQITALDAHAALSLHPRNGNQIEVRSK